MAKELGWQPWDLRRLSYRELVLGIDLCKRIEEG